ncbi:MAG: Rpn family recombination-promoting nuclease/putative transposase [Firmicutes bacterium]|nr:Rpn family recombination-promoting nuclease/putative transposase [Bacillota bacterium]
MRKRTYHKFTEQLMFAIVMRDAELCKELVNRIIPDRRVREVRFSENPVMDALARSIADEDSEKPGDSRSFGWMSAETEKVVIPALLSKSVRFDALFEDEDAWFDIEMQVDWEADMPLRIRYYQASKTITSLETGDEYRKLKPGYVIFICLFDCFGLGEAVYRFQSLEENLYLPLGDKQFTIILNLKCPEEKVPEKLRSFYQYVNHEDAGEDEFTCRIKELVDRANESTEVQNMITVAGDNAYREQKLKAEIEKLEAEKEELEAEKAQAEERLISEKLETARRLKVQGVSAEVISVATGLSMEEVKAL